MLGLRAPARGDLSDKADAHVAAVNLALVEVACRRLGVAVASKFDVCIAFGQASCPVDCQLNRGDRAERLEDLAQVRDRDVRRQV